jgi:hypothetical protein
MRAAACVFVVSCGAAEVDTREQHTGDERSITTGDPRVFAEIAVGASITEYDVDNGGAAPSMSVERRVRINGGSSESRVAGLRVFVDGVELREVGSATYPEVFGFMSSSIVPQRGAPARFELRYQGSTFSFTVRPLEVEFERPQWNEEVPASESLTVTWSGFERAPVDFHLTVTEPCEVGLVPTEVGKTSGVLQPHAGAGRALPCSTTLEARWVLSEITLESPCRALTVGREAIRRQRMVLR